MSHEAKKLGRQQQPALARAHRVERVDGAQRSRRSAARWARRQSAVPMPSGPFPDGRQMPNSLGPWPSTSPTSSSTPSTSCPSAPPLVCGEQRRTYAELDERANRVAHHLAVARRRARRPRRHLRPELRRVGRDDARLLQDPGRPDQRQLPLRRGRAALHLRQRRPGRRRLRPGLRRPPRRHRRRAARSSAFTARRSAPSTRPRWPRRRPTATSTSAPPTTSTSSTPAAPPACPRA